MTNFKTNPGTGKSNGLFNTWPRVFANSFIVAIPVETKLFWL